MRTRKFKGGALNMTSTLKRSQVISTGARVVSQGSNLAMTGAKKALSTGTRVGSQVIATGARVGSQASKVIMKGTKRSLSTGTRIAIELAKQAVALSKKTAVVGTQAAVAGTKLGARTLVATANCSLDPRACIKQGVSTVTKKMEDNAKIVAIKTAHAVAKSLLSNPTYLFDWIPSENRFVTRSRKM